MSSFSTSRQLFSQQLSQLVHSLDSKEEATTNQSPEEELSNRVERLVQDSFVGLGAGGDQVNWKLDTRRVVIETELDQLVQQSFVLDMIVVSKAVFPATEEHQKRLEARLDLLLTFVEAGYVDENVPLQTLAGLFELRPISACEPFLTYIESRVERLTKGMEYQRGRGPILLRLLNDLLRRLPRSKPGPVILSGRILMLLSSVYPLGEKSGVNLRGNFNIAKGTVWEQEEEVKPLDKDRGDESEAKEEGKDESEGTKTEEKKVDKMEVEEGEEEEIKQKASTSSATSFYSTFWSLQKFFNNPHLLFVSPSPAPSTSTSSSFNENPISTLHSSLLTVLSAFSVETKKEKELSGSTTETSGKGKQVVISSSSSSNEGLPSSEAVVMGEKDHLDKTEESLEQYFFPKFLTSRNLLSLELSDPTFRLQLLIQILILIQYLLSLTPSARARAQSLPLTNTSAFPSFVLQVEDEKKMKELEEKSWKEVENMQGGKKVRRAIEGTLLRERNWTDWKLRSCLPFTKPPIEPISQTVTTKLKSMTKPPPKFPYKLGNSRLSRVWIKDLKSLEGFEPDPTEDEFDSIVREWRMTKKKLEMTRNQLKQIGSTTTHPKLSELQSSLEPMTIKLQALHFRALRSASTRYLRHFSQIGSGDLEKLLEAIELERRKREEKEEELIEAELVGGDNNNKDTTTWGGDPESAEVKEMEGEGEGGSTPKAAIRLGEDEKEESSESTDSPLATGQKEPGTPKRPREESNEERQGAGEGEGDAEMDDAGASASKKQKV
ncbi:uncharacterized protein JCM6883_006085 [Sporobolomyces salmoneus]|uniref:uncharacterized protein n=1 Tax=Sporobolomyces salmoneus TaxID=183962 RepID=UPI00316FC5EE